MKDDIMKFMQEFHDNGVLGNGINCSFVTLVPKIASPEAITDFRPISLISSIYKVVAKVLANRMKVVVPKIIDRVQSAFLSGRNIMDGVLVANEIVDWWKKTNRKGLIIKLDFEKAYDTVNWNFLFQMLENFGFGPTWTKWIKECISSARVSILVNGSPSTEFCPQKGLRQGDPLSPFLFNVVAEGLNILISRAKDMGLVRGISVGANGLNISHLQFADDTVLFCEAEGSQILAIKRILRCFEVISGLRINFSKSVVCGVGVAEVEVDEFARKLNCLSTKLPLKYLGLPLGASPSRRLTWRPVVENFKKKLTGWKRRVLSFAGRVTLIKSVLSALPVYYMSLFKIPACVAKELDRIQASFLWGDSERSRKLHLVRWKEVCMSVKQGGLGIKNISLANDSLLLKWWWRYGQEDEALWKMVICEKYGSDGGRWFPDKEAHGPISQIWKDILSVAQRNGSIIQFYKDNVEILIGNGQRISFWRDNWLGSTNLLSQFPRLFQLVNDKEISLNVQVARRVSQSGWAFNFNRPLRAWEEGELVRLTTALGSGPLLRSDVADSLGWKAAQPGTFKVNAVYAWGMLNDGPTHRSVDLIWNNFSPPKAKFFSWLAWRGRLKTKDLLHRVGILEGEEVLNCIFCQEARESLDHVMLHCSFTWKIWSAIIDWWGIQWVIPKSIEGLLIWWLGWKFRKKVNLVWKTLPAAVLWSVWSYRNECVFKAVQPNFQALCECIKVRLAMWMRSQFRDASFSVNDVVFNFSQVRCAGSQPSELAIVAAQFWFAPADGLTFFLVPYDSTPNITAGAAMGLPANLTTGKAFSAFVAVEFDTYCNNKFDPTNKTHVGININSLNSSAYAVWNSNMTDAPKVPLVSWLI
ncbi:uncharacterized protein LOC114276709 [Camellia sinensis]|uniref:uncharacterized protein LOC114276709 n=1 Tax=Camellia sinensis TaxID=4442 RepID=UPI001036026F|nr:uncharacterized protein LOC114276709 [Camellia sinensis]